ncbi:AAA family ATPase [Euzebya sp.]|uniref:ATP-binding protein n=1 Tax=Euzebya sp. TaxID=1971409 RepID=UPI0035137D95
MGASGHAPSGSGAGGDPRTPLLERADQLAALGEAVDGADLGRGATVLLVGPAGVGKTTLLQHATAHAGEGLAVLSARGDALEQAHPWGVAIQLLGPLARRVDAAATFHGAATLAGPLLLHATPEVPDGTPGGAADPLALLHALHWAVANAAERTPLLLVVDDVHWADAASLRLLAFLASRLEGHRVGMALAARTGQPVPTEHQQLLHHLHVHPSIARVDVPALSDGAIRAVVRHVLPDAHDRFCSAVAGAVAGNPFLCHEVTTAVRTAHIVPDEAAASRIGDLRPDGIRTSMLVRLGQSGPGAADVAAAVAVLGPQASVPSVAALTGLSSERVTELIDDLASADLLDAGPALGFAHPIIREVVLDDVGTARRRWLHGRAAAWAQAAGAPDEDVASHLLAADPVTEPWAVEALRRAADRDLLRSAPDRAVELLRCALAAASDRTTRGALLTTLAAAEAAVGDPRVEATADAAVDLLVADRPPGRRRGRGRGSPRRRLPGRGPLRRRVVPARDARVRRRGGTPGGGRPCRAGGRGEARGRAPDRGAHGRRARGARRGAAGGAGRLTATRAGPRGPHAPRHRGG